LTGAKLARSIALACLACLLNPGITGPNRQSCKQEDTKKVIEMDIIDMARASGMTVILDGKIGREEYRSVCGSLSALRRLAEAVRHSTVGSKGNPKRVRQSICHA
jgi:hypothetical protein